MRDEKKTKAELIEELERLRRLVLELDGVEAARKRAVEELKKSEERHRTLQDNVPVGVFRTSAGADGRVLSANAALAKMLGRKSMEDLIDRPVADFYLRREDRERLLDHISSAGTVSGYEVEFKRVDGKAFWGAVSARVVRGDDGKIAYVDGVVEDVTHRKQAEEELARSRQHLEELVAERTGELSEANKRLLREAADRKRVEEEKRYFNDFLSNIIESTQVGIYALDKDGTVKVWNHGMERQFGVDSADIEGKDIFAAFPVLAEEELGTAITNALEKGESFEGSRLRHQTLRRGERILNTKINPLVDPSGSIVGAVVITEDVSERVKATEALRESEERYRSLVEAIHGGFAIVDADENILFVNQAYCDMLGYDKREMVGLNVHDLVEEREFLKMKRATERKMSNREPTKYEIEMKRKDGSRGQFLVSSTPFFDEKDRYKYTLGVVVDITDQKRTEAELKLKTRQLEEAHRRADELLRNILPEQAIAELEKVETPLPRSIQRVTIVFIDIAGFSAISARVNHKALVTKLAAYFHAFDLIIKDYGLEKLKTVGDGYMYAGGLFTGDDQAEACAQAALDILKVVGKRDWLVRIGIHVGPCIAGLIKGWRMIYDVWGDTVNVASRLQEASEPGRINVSKAVYEELADQFDFEYRGELPVYTLGPTPMYFLTGRRGS